MALRPFVYERSRQKVLDHYLRETSLNRFEDGSPGKGILESLLTRMEQAEAYTEVEQRRSSPLTSDGIYLEQWLSWLGLQRKLPSKAFARARDRLVRLKVSNGGVFGDLTGGSPINLTPTNIRFLGSNRIVQELDQESAELVADYVLSEPVTLDPADSEQWISVEAVYPGESYRVDTGQLNEHTFTDYQSFGIIDLVVENVGPIVTGYDGDGLELLRSRILRASLFRSTGVERKIEDLLFDIEGVQSWVLRPRRSGPGTMDIFIDTPSFHIPDSTLRDVEEALSTLQDRGTEFFVDRVERVGVALDLGVRFRNNVDSERRTAIIQAIRQELYRIFLQVGIGGILDLSSFVDEVYRSIPEIDAIGHNNRGFNAAFAFVDGIGGKRIRTSMPEMPIYYVQEFQKLVPESPLIEPFRVYEL